VAAQVAADAAYAKVFQEDDATDGEQSTSSDPELDGMEAVTKELQANARAKAKRRKQTKAASDSQTEEHAGGLQRRRSREQARTEPWPLVAEAKIEARIEPRPIGAPIEELWPLVADTRQYETRGNTSPNTGPLWKRGRGPKASTLGLSGREAEARKPQHRTSL